eukprot:7755417-Pyramimonas_sp.AAC.1
MCGCCGLPSSRTPRPRIRGSEGSSSSSSSSFRPPPSLHFTPLRKHCSKMSLRCPGHACKPAHLNLLVSVAEESRRGTTKLGRHACCP